MSISKLSNGRYRVQVHNPATGRNVAVSKILGPGYASFGTKREAKAARELARQRLGIGTSSVTVAQFRERWITDRLFVEGLKVSSVAARRESTSAFVRRYGDLQLRQVTDKVVAEWLAGPAGRSTVPVLKAMWNAAGSAKAGRLVADNPWAGLGLKQSRGRRDQTPPTEVELAGLIEACRKQSGDQFAAWFTVAAYTGMRPGEVDALRWDRIDFERGRIHVVEQFSHKAKVFTTPKNGLTREALLTPLARAALTSLPRVSEFCFVNQWGNHFRGPLRSMIWQRVRAQTGYEGDLYLATRHFAGSYMVNVLGLPYEAVAAVLGHTDGGKLVRELYGHPDNERLLLAAQNAYENVGCVVPLSRESSA